MADTVNLFGHETPKKALLIGGGLAIVAGGAWVYLQHRNAASGTTAAAGDTTDTGDDSSLADEELQDSGAIDPNTGLPYSTEGGSVGSVSVGASGFTTNAAWSQFAISELEDPAGLSAALGVYLTGGVPTAAQETLIDEAIAIAGYPPVAGPANYPPGIRTQPTTTQTNPPPPAPPKTPTPPSPLPPKKAPTPPKAKTYTVKSGDTLSGIASKEHVSESTLYSKNKTKIEAAAKKHGHKSSDNGHWIFPGTVLTLP